ncbi:MAG TPA: nodulation protein NfeD [Candidatus Acidoferrales bacterium]|nr:nodulation protein NfeD [Candidatus Acidoferrales bacterium]
MKRASLFIALFGLLSLPVGSSFSATPDSSFVLLTVAGPIDPASADYISRGISGAESQRAAAVILQLDTPGGLDTSMRQIVQAEMNARVPVVVYVAPKGARAASAGCFIVLAADVAAMAPGTNIGAAHPIFLGGGTVSEKILNDAAAYARSIAAARHRNVDWAEKAVRESVSLSDLEALQQHIIDLTASDLPDMLRQLNGRTIHMAGGDITLSLAGAQQISVGMNWREQVLSTLSDPTIAYLLFLLGVLAIVVEVFAPHGFVTGSLGVVAVVLALIGLANLPVNLAGALLLILGMVLLGLELKITSHGFLTLAGLVAFIFGSFLLLPRLPGFRISIWAIAVVALLWVLILGLVVRLVLKARRAPAITGVQRVVGSIGTAKTELAPRGVVLVNGEDWDARADAPPIARGEKIEVVEIRGLTLLVRKVA